MLGKHPDEYPRFRDCFVEKNCILVHTRTGGGNREDYETENNEMTNHPNYMTDYDDSFDSTYANFIFSVPEKWKDDFNKIVNGRLSEISNEYKAEIFRVFPKIKDKLEALFNQKPERTQNEQD